MSRQIPIIVGPTAVGKTAFSLSLADDLEAEIVGGDSRQIYRYLDIGTAKPEVAQRRAVRHHLIDVVDPDETLDAARFARMAWGCIRDIEVRHKQPLVVGGSGLYIRALTEGLFRGPGANPRLRAALEAEAHTLGVSALHRRLAEVDPTAARRIHPHDRVRIIRALEIYTLTGTPISRWQHQWRSSLGHESFVFIGLRRERDDLRRRIVARTEAMLQLGLEAEVQALLARGYAPTLPPLQSVGYGEIVASLMGAFDLARAQELIVRHTWRLAKRQMTWFRRLPGVHWISLTEMSEASVRQTVQTILRRAWDAQESPSTRVMMGDQEIHCRCPTPT